MATEKIMNSRIRLKYDSLQSWQNSAFNGDDKTKYLKAGEAAVVVVDTWKLDAQGNQILVPTCLMKIGDGNTKFDSLNWIAAQAADVYDWAKQSAFFTGEEITTTPPNDDGESYTGNAYTSIEWDSTLNNGKGGLKLVKGTQFATKAELDAALDAFGGDLDAITDNNTKYTFSIPTEGDHAGELAVTEINYVNGEAEGAGTTTYYDFVTPEELEARIPTELGVMSVTGKDAIDATGAKDVEVSLKLDDTGNVTLTQGTNGLKAEVTAADLGLESAMHFIGVSTTDPSEGAGTGTVTIDNKVHTPANGDVVLYQGKEYVYGNNKWNELGDEGSHALKTVKVEGGDGLTGGGTLEANRIISHAVPDGASNGHTYNEDPVGGVYPPQAPNHGESFLIPVLTTDKFGHVISKERASVTLPSLPQMVLSVTADEDEGIEVINTNPQNPVVNIKDGGVTTEKIADHAVGAHQTKACVDYKNEDGTIPTDAEVWVFYCGSASVLV